MKKTLIIIFSIIAVIAIAAGVVLGVLLNKPKEFTVTFDSDGGSVVPSQTVEKGGYVTKPTDPTKTDCSFIGWYFGESKWEFATQKVEKDITLKAKWQEIEDENPDNPDNPDIEEPSYFSVSFFVDGVAYGNPQSIEEDKKATKPVDPTSKEGYDFVGWYKEDTFENEWNFETDKVTANTNLYAKFEIKTFEVKFVDWNGNVLKTENVNYGGNATAPEDPERDSDVQYTYEFDVWDTEFVGVTSNLVVKATYTSSLRSYNVKFMVDNAEYDSVTKNYGEKVIAPETDPSKEGYDFVGWYKEEACENEWNFENETVQGETSIYAKFKIKVYNVVFLDGDGEVFDRQKVEHGKAAKVRGIPTKTANAQYEYEFDKWETDFTNITGDLEVTPLFISKTRTFTVLFVDMSTGKILDEQNVKFGENATFPDNPVKPDTLEYEYKFTGWSVTNLTNITSNMTVYANFNQTARQYTVTFMSDGNIVATKKVGYSNSVSKPANPVKDGCIFKGWMLDGELQGNYIYVYSDMTLEAAWEQTSELFTFTSYKEGYSVREASGVTYGETLTIPSTFGGKPVLKIEDGAFYDRNGVVKNIIIEEGIKEIGESAFNGTAVEKIELPSGIESIGESAFSNTAYYNNKANWEGKSEYDLNILYIGEYLISAKSGETYYSTIENVSVKEGTILIADNAFSNVTVANLELPTSLLYIGNSSFINKEICTLNLPENLISIGEWAFQSNYRLSSVKIPSSVTSIGKGAFYECIAMKEVIFEENSSLTELPSDAFGYCYRLENIVFPDSLIVIGEEAFSSCNSLDNVVIPQSVRKICRYAFSSSGLKTIYIPQAVEEIGSGVINGNTVALCEAEDRPSGWSADWNNNGKAYFGMQNPNEYVVVYDILYVLENGEAVLAKAGSGIKEVVIPESVVINGVEYPVTIIGEKSLTYNIEESEGFTLPSTIREIRSYAISSLGKSDSLIIPASVEIVKSRAFSVSGIILYCEAESKPEGWSNDWNYDAQVFWNYNSSNETQIDGVTYTIKNGKAAIVKVDKNITSIVIPEEVNINGKGYIVTEIPAEAFANCSKLKSVVLSDNIIEIGERAFERCSKLESIDLSNVVKIKNSAFYECMALKQVTIPTSVKEIAGAFGYCYNVIFYCEISEEQSKLAPYAFESNWNNGRPIYWEVEKEDIISQGGLKYLLKEDYAIVVGFDNDIESNVVLKETITHNGVSYAVTEIGTYAFNGCSKLSDFVILPSLTTIGDYAFTDCSSLKQICMPNTLSVVGREIFKNVAGMTIYVEADKTPEGWASNWSMNTNGNCYFGMKEEINIDGIKYSIESKVEGDRRVSIIGYVGNDKNLFIPSVITYNGNEYQVKTIKTNAFLDCTGLTSVHIMAQTISKIELNAFKGCTNASIYLESIGNPFGTGLNGTANVYVDALVGRTYLEQDGIIYYVKNGNEVMVTGTTKDIQADVVIPDSVTINGNAYRVANIAKRAFANCPNLESVVLPDTITSIGEYAFVGCINLEKLFIPSSVTTMGNYIIDSDSNRTTLYFEVASKPSSGWGYLSSSSAQYWGVTEDDFISEDGLQYIIQGEEAEVSGIEFGQKEVVIKEEVEINGKVYKVSSIGSYAFADIDTIKNITIPESIKTIKRFAFYRSNGLNYLYIPSSVETMEDSAVAYCDEIVIYVEPEAKLPTWSNYWLNNTYVPIYYGVTQGDFVEVDDVQYIIQGESAEVALVNRKAKRIEIKKEVEINGRTYKVESINERAIRNSAVETVVLPSTITELPAMAFYSCQSLKEVLFSEECNLKVIGDNAFYWCESLINFEIPDSVEVVEYEAFYRCLNLESIFVPASVQTMGSKVFYACPKLTITCGVAEKPLGWSDDWNYSGNPVIWQGEGEQTIQAKVDSIVYELKGDGTAKVLGQDLFTYAKSVVVPEKVLYNDKQYTVTSIDSEAFYGCNYLCEITLPDTITSIGDCAFTNCYALVKINLPKNLTSLGFEAFINCYNLKEVTIPKSLETMGSEAFKNCGNLTSVNFEQGSALTAILGGTFSRCFSLNNITLPDSITLIEGGIFDTCVSLESIVIPENVESIGGGVFNYCRSLKNVIFAGEKVTTIKSAAFAYCNSLESITIPQSVELIESGAFEYCTSLKTATILNADCEVSENAFEYCINLNK